MARRLRPFRHLHEFQTDQFVVLGGEFGEPLVELQNCDYCHQVPAEEKQTEMDDKTAAAINYL